MGERCQELLKPGICDKNIFCQYCVESSRSIFVLNEFESLEFTHHRRIENAKRGKQRRKESENREMGKIENCIFGIHLHNNILSISAPLFALSVQRQVMNFK